MNYELLQSIIEKRGVTITKLAQAAKMSWEGFKRSLHNRTITVETLERIAEFLDVHPCIFFDDQYQHDRKQQLELMQLYKNLADERLSQIRDKEMIIQALNEKTGKKKPA